MVSKTGTFVTQFKYFRLRNNYVWFENLPAFKVKAKKSALDLSGSYEIIFPNPRGAAVDLFKHFQEQELWFAYIPDKKMHQFLVGQINRISPEKNNTVKLEGRGLAGYFYDRKINDSWVSKRGDFILCDPTFGAIPMEFDNITTWNAFTDDFDKFDYWNSTRWSTQPAYCEIYDGELEVVGNAGATRTVTDATEYKYRVIEFRIKASAASNTVNFGFTNSGRTQYVQFSLASGAVNCQNEDASSSQTSPTVNSVTQTNYNYYRIEWDTDEARFFVNGVLEITETSNVPSGNLTPFFEMDTTSETLTIDYMKVIKMTKKFGRFLSKQKILMDVVREICDIGNNTTTFTFYLDNKKDFHSYQKKTESSGKNYGYNSSLYTGAYEKIYKIDLNEEAKDLYNSVRITGGEVLTEVASPTWVDQFIGDGTQTTWALGYKAKKSLTLVQVNSVTKTEDTDFTVTYGKESSIIKFTTAPTNTHSINLRYDYYTPIIATVRNEESINAYKVTREYYKNDENITSIDRARDYARALLAFFSDPRVVIKVGIPLDPSLEVGTSIMVDAPFFNIINQEYEIISIENEMSPGTWETKLTLADTDIDTNAEIIREILQQLKDLRSRGETTEIVTEDYALSDKLNFSETLEYKSRLVCDSFILGNSENSKLGMGEITDDMTDNTNWTPTNCTLSDNTDSTYYWVGGASVKLVWANSTEANISQTVSKDYSDYSAGTSGLWVYAATSSQLSNIKLRFTDGSANYSEYNYNEIRGSTFEDNWNYLTFDLDSPDATSGTLDWTDITNVKIYITKSTAAGTIYLDYLTVSKSTSIGLNGLGYRFLDEVDYTEIATG